MHWSFVGRRLGGKDEAVVVVPWERGKYESVLSAGSQRIREFLSMTRNTLNLTSVKK